MEMKRIEDEKQVDGMSQGKESKVSSTSSRIESIRNGKSFEIFSSTVKYKYSIS